MDGLKNMPLKIPLKVYCSVHDTMPCMITNVSLANKQKHVCLVIDQKWFINTVNKQIFKEMVQFNKSLRFLV